LIRNIIFDLGNVLLEFNPMDYLKQNISDNLLIDELYENIFRSKEWVKLDKGEISDEEAVEIICSRIPHRKVHVEHYMKNWHNILKPMEDTVSILESVKKMGCKAYVLSNFHKNAFRKVYDMYDFFKFFDGGVVSADVKLIKPGEQIYKVLLDKYNIVPEESLFIDDMQENIDAAKKLGINTIRFTSGKDLKYKLKEYDIFIG
jgi:putative hydrolase of the HAD superfamily